MNLLFETLDNLLETIVARAFDKYNLVVQFLEHIALEQVGCCMEEVFLHLETVCRAAYLIAHAYNLVYSATVYELCHLAVQVLGIQSGLKHVAEDERVLSARNIGTATHKVERDVERVDIAVITVVDERAAVVAVLHLKAHGNRLKTLHLLGDDILRNHHVKTYAQAVEGILDRCIIYERNGEVAVGSDISVRDVRLVLLLLYRTDEQRFV